jgi:hypothetical protein
LGHWPRLRAVTLRSIAHGGPSGAGEPYKAVLRDIYRYIDRPWHHDFEDFEAMINFPEPEPEVSGDVELSVAAAPQRRGLIRQVIGRLGFG